MSSTRPRLITIPISHYCEKARWALDRAGIDYDERPHIQGIHVWHARRAGGGRTVPVLVSGEEVIADSTAILVWADRRLPPERRLYPAHGPSEARVIEDWLDEGLGPDGRLWMYHQTLQARRAMRPWIVAGIPRSERAAFSVAGWALEPFIRRYLGVDEQAARTALASVDRVFDEIAVRLADGRPFLTGERFTAADLTFGALSASVLVPPEYGSPLPQPQQLPAAMASEVRRLREHPAGRFAARLYATERGVRRGSRGD